VIEAAAGAEGHAVHPLSARQRDVLAVITRFYRATGEPPSVLYVARRLTLSRGAIREHIEALHRKGWLVSPSPAGLRCPHEP
jgi:SOS-response transcriptional repressor LexA